MVEVKELGRRKGRGHVQDFRVADRIFPQGRQPFNHFLSRLLLRLVHMDRGCIQRKLAPLEIRGRIAHPPDRKRPEVETFAREDIVDFHIALFVQPKDSEKETWTGYRVGVEQAKELYQADQVFSIQELQAKLPSYLAKADRIYYRIRNGKLLELVGTMRSVLCR